MTLKYIYSSSLLISFHFLGLPFRAFSLNIGYIAIYLFIYSTILSIISLVKNSLKTARGLC